MSNTKSHLKLYKKERITKPNSSLDVEVHQLLLEIYSKISTCYEIFFRYFVKEYTLMVN